MSGKERWSGVPASPVGVDEIKNLFDAQTILQATTDNTPAALIVNEQTVVGRITGGNIAALTNIQVMSIIANTIVSFEDTVVLNEDNIVYN